MTTTKSNPFPEPSEPQVGSRAVFHGRWPWHLYYCRVIGEDAAYREDAWGTPRAAWIVRWEGDAFDAERTGKVGYVPKYVALAAFHFTKEAK